MRRRPRLSLGFRRRSGPPLVGQPARLVPLEAARQVTETAKLNLLVELLPTLLEAGRRILRFSQFTSMLVRIGQHRKSELVQALVEDGAGGPHPALEG